MPNASPVESMIRHLAHRFAEERQRLSDRIAAVIAEMNAERATMILDLSERVAAIRNGLDGKDGKDGRDGVDGLPGEKGQTGEAGAPGRDGHPGDPGQPGERGERGEKGEPGDPGPAGPAGEKGDRGDPGDRGEPGETGETGGPGLPGPAGERGERGERGPAGQFTAPQPWRETVFYESDLVHLDGSTYCAKRDTGQRPPHEDWTPVALAGRDAYAGEARGLYDPDATYRSLDRVAQDGSEWIARRDDPGPLPGDGWMLGARAGSRGKPGERGPKGDRGERGIGVSGLRLVDWSMIVELSDGDAVTVDLRPLFERFMLESGR